MAEVADKTERSCQSLRHQHMPQPPTLNPTPSHSSRRCPVNKRRQADNREDCQPVAVLRAGVEPAQVSLSVFETDASTDSAIGAVGFGLWVQRYTYF